MASDNRSDQRAAPERKEPKGLRSPTGQLPWSNPPILSDGLETLRSGHC